MVLEQIVPGRYLLYRILDGFGRGGIFAFDVRPVKPGVNLLSIYVGFDFYRGKGPARPDRMVAVPQALPQLRPRRRLEPLALQDQIPGRGG